MDLRKEYVNHRILYLAAENPRTEILNACILRIPKEFATNSNAQPEKKIEPLARPKDDDDSSDEEDEDIATDSYDPDVALTRTLNKLTDSQKKEVKTEFFAKWTTPPSEHFNKIDLGEMIPLSRAMATCSYNFVTLTLVSCGISAMSLKVLADNLANCATIKTISIENNILTKANLDIDLEIFKNINPTIKSDEKNSFLNGLDTFSSSSSQATVIKKSIWAYFIEKVKKCKFLSLRTCGINDDDLIDISNILKTSSNLISLNLFGNDITDQGGIALSKALRTNAKLVSLNLAMNNKITDVTGIALAGLFKPFVLEGDNAEETFDSLKNMLYTSYYGPDKLIDLSVVPPTPSVAGPDKKPAKNSLQPIKEFEDAIVVIGLSKNNKSKKVAPPKKKGEPEEQEEPFKITIPGNFAIKSLNCNMNRLITDKTALAFKEALSNNAKIGLNRLSFVYTQISQGLKYFFFYSFLKNF